MISEEEFFSFIKNFEKGKDELHKIIMKENPVHNKHNVSTNYFSPPFVKRWDMFKELRSKFPPNWLGIDKNMPDNKAIRILMKEYDSYLYLFYDEFDQRDRFKILNTFCESISKVIETTNIEMFKDKYKSPLSVPEYAWSIIEIYRPFMKHLSKFENNLEYHQSRFRHEIFNLYINLMVATPKKKLKKDKKQPEGFRYQTQFEKYIRNKLGNKNIKWKDIDKLASDRDQIILDALKDVKNPLWAVFDQEIADWIIEFLLSFEKCYEKSLHDHPVSRKSKTNNRSWIRDIIRRTYQTNEVNKAFEKRLDKWKIVYSEVDKKYKYRRIFFTSKWIYTSNKSVKD